MSLPRIVSQTEWEIARNNLLENEKMVRVTQAFLKMKKFDLETLQRAFDEN